MDGSPIKESNLPEIDCRLLQEFKAYIDEYEVIQR